MNTYLIISVGERTGRMIVFVPPQPLDTRQRKRSLYGFARAPDEVPRFGLDHLEHAATVRRVFEDIKRVANE